MSNFQSFQSYQAPNNAGASSEQGSAPITVRPRIDANAGQTTRVSVRDGEIFTEHSSTGQMSAGELNPHHGDGTAFATAQAMPGTIGLKEVTLDTLITIDGVQAPVKFFEAEGLVHRGADGRWQEGPGEGQQAATEQAPTADTADDLMLPSEAAALVNQALEGVSDQQLAPLVGLGVSVATGEVDRGRLELQMQRASGLTPAEAAVRLTTMESAYQAQADAAITSRTGLAAADLPDFYEWAKENSKGALRDAITNQVHGNSFKGYRALAAQYLAANPPSLAAVQAGGFETRQEGKQPEVKIEGRWMTIATAARLGIL